MMSFSDSIWLKTRPGAALGWEDTMAWKLSRTLMVALLLVSGAAFTGCNDTNEVPVFIVPPPPAPSDALTYAGSDTCRTCHASIWDTWYNSRHPKKVREASLDTVVNDANSNTENDFVEGGVDIEFNVATTPPPGQTSWDTINFAPGIEPPMLGYDGTNLLMRLGPNTYTISYVLGGTGKWKQRYMITIGEAEYISPLQYNDVPRQYTTYHPEHWYVIDGKTGQYTGYLYGAGDTPVSAGNQRNSWQRRCTACHTTGARNLTKTANDEYGASIATMLGNEQGETDIAFLSDLPVACEACHGPSQRHVELGGGIGTTVNPSNMSADLADNICGSCHNRGSSKNAEGFGFPWGEGELYDNAFLPGMRVDDIFNPTPRDGTRFWQSGSQRAKSHRQQFLEHRATPHARAGVTCYACHNPHGSEHNSDIRLPANALCLSCHDGQGNIDSSDLVAHTKHLTWEGQQCTACHMVHTAKSAVNYDIASHVYDVIFPIESEQAPGMPNSCGVCHVGESTTQLTSRVAARFPMARPVAFASAELNGADAGWDLKGDMSFDPLGGPISFQWSLVTGPPGFSMNQVIAATSDRAIFVPAATGDYVFQLVVTNQRGVRSRPSPVKINVTEVVEQTPIDPTQSNYMGARVCQSCHADVHASWEITRHTQKVRRPNEGYGVEFADTDLDDENDWKQNGLGGFNLATGPIDEKTVFDEFNYDDGIDPPIIRYDSGNDEYLFTIGPNTYTVTWLLGGTGKWKQRYMATIGEGEYIGPIQFNSVTNEWVAYHVEHWYTYDDNDSSGGPNAGDTLTGYIYGAGQTPVGDSSLTRNSWQRRCTACHSTGATDMSRDPVTFEYGAAIQTMLNQGTLADPGISCEACHGPGSQHVAAPLTLGSIVNPAKLSSQEAAWTCGACHNRGSSVNSQGFGYPWNEDAVDGNYIPTLDLDDYFVPTDEAGSRFWSDPYGHAKSHRQEWLDMRWSAHFANAGMTCSSCHASHEANVSGQLIMPANQLCLSCHNSIVADRDASSNHSRHPSDSPGNQCASCHMPKTAKSAVSYDIAAHSWQIIYPQATDDTDIPNSCTACHGDNTDDIQSDINRYFGDLNPHAVARVVNLDDKSRRSGTFDTGSTVTLDGTKSYDPNGQNIVTYTWSLLSAPAGSAAPLSSRLVAQPTFTPDEPGDYVFSLVVKDASGTSRPDTVTVTAEDD